MGNGSEDGCHHQARLKVGYERLLSSHLAYIYWHASIRIVACVKIDCMTPGEVESPLQNAQELQTNGRWSRARKVSF